MRPYTNKTLWRLNPKSEEWEFQRKCLRGTEQVILAESRANEPSARFRVSLEKPPSRAQTEHTNEIRKGGKSRLAAEIRKLSAQASRLRKMGVIAGALLLEKEIDRLSQIAEEKGWAVKTLH